MSKIHSVFESPSITSAQRDALANPQLGWIITNSTTNTVQFYNGTVWGDIGGGGGGGATKHIDLTDTPASFGGAANADKAMIVNVTGTGLDIDDDSNVNESTTIETGLSAFYLSSVPDSATILKRIFTMDFTLDTSNSRQLFTCETAPSAQTDYTIWKETAAGATTNMGTIRFPASSLVGTVFSPTTVLGVSSDFIWVESPAAQNDLAGLYLNIVCKTKMPVYE